MNNSTDPTDPTLEFLKRFDNPEDWIVVPNVPIFKPHERYNADGSVKYRVDQARLDSIVQTMDMVEQEDGVVPRIQISHTKTEGEPEILGYVRNRRVGEWGPKKKTGILGDFWYRKDKFAKAQEYPYRSAEFYPKRNRIDAVAHIARDPELDLGMVACARGDDVEFYSLQEPSMPEPVTTPAVPALTAADVSKLITEAFEKYERKTAPPPKPTILEPDQVRLVREEHAVEYKRAQDQIARLEKELEVERYHRRTATAESQVKQLVAEGFVVKNQAKLIEKLSRLGDEEVKDELATIRENYSRVPLEQSPIRTASDSDKTTTREQYERAIAVATEKGISYDAALAEVRGAK